MNARSPVNFEQVVLLYFLAKLLVDFFSVELFNERLRVQVEALDRVVDFQGFCLLKLSLGADVDAVKVDSGVSLLE